MDPQQLKDGIVNFLKERGFGTKDGKQPNSVDVFGKTGPTNAIFLGTLNFSNPSQFVLSVKETENIGIAINVARTISGGMEKSVSLD